MFGRVDPNDPKGILRESGFGVEFPNYIVDVKTGANGEYTEAIQFQCLERGGVRVFEGINFMSRSPTMTDDEMASMHSRAEKAGMYPYGASPQQMHTVARRPIDAPAIDNNWQAMWRAIGVDKLLELLEEVQDNCLSLIGLDVDVRYKYGIWRSLRHGVTSLATNHKVTKNLIYLINRWRSERDPQGQSSDILTIYTDLEDLIPTLISY